MSTVLFFFCRANPGPGLAIAGLNLVVAAALVCVSLLLGIAVLLTWLYSFGERMAGLAFATKRIPLPVPADNR